MSERCRHRHTWMLLGQPSQCAYEYCWRCGAIRQLVKHDGGITHYFEPCGKWVRPVGPIKPNPIDLFTRSLA